MGESGSDAERLGRLAVELQGRGDVIAVLERVVAAAVSDVPGADLAGVTIVDRQGAQTPASSDPLVAQIDTLQYSSGQGPCLDAAQPDSEPVVRSDDLATDPRWPTFSTGAAEIGVASMLSVQMFVDAGTIGALNLYAKRSGAFDLDSEHIAIPLAMHAAVAITATRTEANLRLALTSRDVIGQAKGILMERLKISADEAFDLLITASQGTNRKLREVADTLAATGELVLPAAEPDPRR